MLPGLLRFAPSDTLRNAWRYPGPVESDPDATAQQSTIRGYPYCSFCGKHADQVETVVAGPTSAVLICSECIDLCGEIVAERRADAKALRPGEP